MQALPPTTCLPPSTMKNATKATCKQCKYTILAHAHIFLPLQHSRSTPLLLLMATQRRRWQPSVCCGRSIKFVPTTVVVNSNTHHFPIFNSKKHITVGVLQVLPKVCRKRVDIISIHVSGQPHYCLLIICGCSPHTKTTFHVHHGNSQSRSTMRSARTLDVV